MICNLSLHMLGVSFDQHVTNTFACANYFLTPIVSACYWAWWCLHYRNGSEEKERQLCAACVTLFLFKNKVIWITKKRKKPTVAWPLAANDNNQWWLVGLSILDFKPWEEAWITTCVLFYITLEHRDAIHILHLIQTLHWIFQSLITGWWLSPWARVFKICTYLYLKVDTWIVQRK